MTIPAPRRQRPIPPPDHFRDAADNLLAEIERDADRRTMVEQQVQAGRRQAQAALARAQAIHDAIAAGASPARIPWAGAPAAPSVRRPSAARRRPALTSRPVIW